MMIQISGQYGDPKADELFWPIQKRLNECFKETIQSKHFDMIKMFSIVFRVSGKTRDFGGAGPERMQFIKRDAEITIDLVFPENYWRNVVPSILKSNIVSDVKNCLDLMRIKAQEIDNTVNSSELNVDIDGALSLFFAN